MFEKLMHQLKMLAAVPTPFDPSRFGDPVALQTAWTPACRGGTNIRTHKLIKPGPNRIEFRASFGALVFYLVFLLPGLGMVIGFFVMLLSAETFDAGSFVFLFLGLLFAGVGGYLLNAGIKPIVFERARGLFWKGRKGPDEAFSRTAAAPFTRWMMFTLCS